MKFNIPITIVICSPLQDIGKINKFDTDSYFLVIGILSQRTEC